jgi:hypothetical protein
LSPDRSDVLDFHDGWEFSFSSHNGFGRKILNKINPEIYFIPCNVVNLKVASCGQGVGISLLVSEISQLWPEKFLIHLEICSPIVLLLLTIK